VPCEEKKGAYMVAVYRVVLSTFSYIIFRLSPYKLLGFTYTSLAKEMAHVDPILSLSTQVILENE